jgi:tRNA threonylcarbamoyladenosine biosynthesis protein TsaE
MIDRPTTLSFFTDSVTETAGFGEALGAAIRTGVCFSLVGALGAGKTVLAGGICRGLDVTEDVLSPTFILYEEFAGRLPVIHIDLYRLRHESEIEELGVFDAIGGDKVILAEWGDRSEALMRYAEVVIELSSPTEDNSRRLDIHATEQAAVLFENLRSW